LRPDPIPDSASKLSAPEVVTPTTPARPSDSSGSDTQEADGSESAPSVKQEPKTEPTPTDAPAPKPKPVASTEVYTVQDGDVIISIAEDWFAESGRHDEIIALNPGVDPTRLQIGQILKMPPKDQPRNKPVDPTLAANEYRIAPNDNYTRIARLLLGDEARASEIVALNPDLDPGNLQVGTIIKLPPKRVGTPEARPLKRPPLRTGEKYYTVKSGDSLARIVGDLWGVQREDWVELLYQRNKETIGEDRTKLNLEQILVIPVKPKS
jgi:LysM repeat protein